MATDQNIKNKTLASEIATAYGRYVVDWHSCNFAFILEIKFCTTKTVIEQIKSETKKKQKGQK